MTSVFSAIKTAVIKYIHGTSPPKSVLEYVATVEETFTSIQNADAKEHHDSHVNVLENGFSISHLNSNQVEHSPQIYENETFTENKTKGEDLHHYEGVGQITNMATGMHYGFVDNEYRFSQAQFAGKGFYLHDKVHIKAERQSDSINWVICEMNIFKEQTFIEIEERQKYLVSQRKVKCVTSSYIDLEPFSTISANSMDRIKNTLPEIQLIPGDWLEVKTEETNRKGTSAYGIGSIFVNLFEEQEVMGKITDLISAKLCDDEFERLYAVFDRYCLVTPVICGTLSLQIGLPVRVNHFKSYQTLISSQKEMKFCYRAISIYEDESKVLDTARIKIRELCQDKRGICIQPAFSLNFGRMKFGSKKEENFILNNTSPYDHALLDVRVESDQTVSKFSVSVKRESESIIALLSCAQRRNVEVKIQCEPLLIGQTKDYCVFDFGEFQIYRELQVIVVTEQEELIQQLVTHRVGLKAHRLIVAEEQKEVERKHAPFAVKTRPFVLAGIPPIRPAFFKIQVERIGAFKIPDVIHALASNEIETTLFEQYPHLKAAPDELSNRTARKLTPQNYKDLFHVALWLEECFHFQTRQKYNLERVVFEKSGDSYIIDFPSLQDVFPKFSPYEPLQFCDPGDPDGKIYKANITRLTASKIFFDLKLDTFQYDGRPMSVEFLLGRTCYKRCHHAVDNIMENFGADWLFQETFNVIDPRISFIVDEDSGNYSDEIKASLSLLYTKRTRKVSRPTFGMQRIGGKRNPSVFPPKQQIRSSMGDRESLLNTKLRWANKTLNDEQKMAVRMILRGQARPSPYIIFGPPGTGKSVTVVEAVVQINRLSPDSRILVCGPSNASANQIALYLMEIGKFEPGEFVRFLGYNRSDCSIPELLIPYCLDGNNLEHVYMKRIIVTTCNSAGQFIENYGVVDGWLTHVFIDEAGYCYEPDSVIPCLLVSKNTDPPQIILAGDPNQLGPVIFSDMAGYYGLRVSFLERLMESSLYKRGANHKYEPLLLTKLIKNYRAHRDLLALPSKLFYDDELVSATKENLDELCENLQFLPKPGIPLLFHGIRGAQSRDSDSPSWYNTYEVIQVIKYVELLLQNHCIADDIGIISPYRKQVEKIKEALRREVRCRPIRVGSTEEFQGGEKKIIILSLVRSMDIDDSSSDKLIRLSFAFHPKRFNVCVTRAKCLLICIGNPHVFANEIVWREFMKYAIMKGVYVGCDLPLLLKDFQVKCKTGIGPKELNYESSEDSDEENVSQFPNDNQHRVSTEGFQTSSSECVSTDEE